MKKIFYRKLVRDKIPDIIKARGSDLSTRALNQKEYVAELLKKVGEEATGLLSAENKKEITQELADIIDVIDEIKKIKKITSIQIKEAQRKKVKISGGFNKRLYLVWSSDDGYKTNERRNV